ncbi:tryptophan--tRNA ligase [Candidatus Gracilibacteria bacterium]|nr:tryptophan--tRNA ligase [Candidatus Gracilibacteria bacterium]
MKKVLTGIKPTGNGMHIGNYFGAFKPIVDISKGNTTYLMLADLHSLTSVHDGEVLRSNKKRVLMEYFALLPEDSEIIVFEQSAADFHDKTAGILHNLVPYSLMLRAHSFKDSQNKNSDINMGVFNYPILMAADILLYDTDIVPVGKDQKQHLEFARDIAGFFNKTYKTDLFKLPEPHIEESVMTIPGTDGRKMSKSYDNFIGIFDSEKVMKKKIMSIVTGSEELDDPKNPENCNVFALIQLFADTTRQNEIAAKYKAGGYGYGHAKLELLEIILEYFKAPRQRFADFENDMSYIENKLEAGNSLARNMAEKKYNEMMELVGLK